VLYGDVIVASGKNDDIVDLHMFSVSFSLRADSNLGIKVDDDGDVLYIMQIYE
jgi:hypothetical protein